MHRGLIVAALLASASPAHADAKEVDYQRAECVWQNILHYAEWVFPDFRVQAVGEPGGGVDWDLIASWPVTLPFYLDDAEKHALLTPFVEPQIDYSDRQVRALVGARITLYPRWKPAELGLALEVAGAYDEDGPALVAGIGVALDWGWDQDDGVYTGGRTSTTPIYRRTFPRTGPQRNDVALDTVIAKHATECPAASEY
jgi:hypothetical protein